MNDRKRTDLKIRLLLDSIGAICTLIGIGGLAGAAEGRGGFLAALTVFAIGATEVLWSNFR